MASITLNDTMEPIVKAYAETKGVSITEAGNMLIGSGHKRLTAIHRYADAQRDGKPKAAKPAKVKAAKAKPAKAAKAKGPLARKQAAKAAKAPRRRKTDIPAIPAEATVQ